MSAETIKQNEIQEKINNNLDELEGSIIIGEKFANLNNDQTKEVTNYIDQAIA